uniref:large ribosomal subunit protein mL62-like n=1 Tax=Myxine glutinosa TaxID=7769 RepID=UPI00358F053F
MLRRLCIVGARPLICQLGPPPLRNFAISREETPVYIPIDRLKISCCKSSGPGGQNVNKVNSKVEIRFHVETADWLPAPLREKILQQYHGRMTLAGELIIRDESSRYQLRNKASCLQKLRDIIEAVSCQPEEPHKLDSEQRRLRVEAMQRERLQQKRIRSRIKQDRKADLD